MPSNILQLANPLRGLTPSEKTKVVVGGVVVLTVGYYSPTDNRTVALAAIFSGLAVAWEEGAADYVHELDNLTPYQRLIAFALIGGATGVIIDMTLRPKLSPRGVR